MKQRSRKLSIRMKIILSVIGIMVIVFGFLGGTSIITMRTNLIEMGGEQAQVAAGLALSVVDADELVKLKPGDEDGKLYNSIVEPLREMQKACGVKYMYTLTTDGSKVYYGVDTDEKLQTKVRLTKDTFTPQQIADNALKDADSTDDATVAVIKLVRT